MTGGADWHIAKIKIIPEIPVPSRYQRNFKAALEILAGNTNVPVALIMKLGQESIEVFSTNSHEDNPYKEGNSEHLQSGLYCETVIKTGQRLVIPDATKDEKWQDNPDIKLHMIAYMGLPLCWPCGALFGTICILNSKEDNFNDLDFRFLKTVHDAIEADLAQIYEDYCRKLGATPEAKEATVSSRE